MTRTLAALFVCALAPATVSGFDYEMFRKLTESLVKVEALNPDGSVSVGTGVVVGRGFVATNCHVTQRAGAIELVKGGRRMSAESQHADVARDLCLLSVPHADWMAAAELVPDRLRTGEPVHAVGYIFGVAARVSSGHVKALYDYAGGQVIQSTTPFTSGASGGGLFDEQARLVGIVTFRYPGGESYHFSLPAQWVVDALASYNGKPVIPVAGTPFWLQSSESQPFFLHAASLEAEGRWPQLAEIARQWTVAEPNNATSWFMLGRAHYEMKQNAVAIDAAQAAVRIDPRHSEAWYSLGLAHAARGDRDATVRVHEVLRDLDARLASELSRHALECSAAPVLPC